MSRVPSTDLVFTLHSTHFAPAFPMMVVAAVSRPEDEIGVRCLPVVAFHARTIRRMSKRIAGQTRPFPQTLEDAVRDGWTGDACEHELCDPIVYDAEADPPGVTTLAGLFEAGTSHESAIAVVPATEANDPALAERLARVLRAHYDRVDAESTERRSRRAPEAATEDA